MGRFAYYLSKVLDTTTKLIWYYAFIYSLLKNFNVVISSASRNLISKIQTSQHKIIKILFFSELLSARKNFTGIKSINDKKIIKNDSIINFMNEVGILNYTQMNDYHLINFILKQLIIKQTKNENRFNIGFKTINLSNSEINTRQDYRLKLPFYNKTIGQKKIDFRSAVILNKIPADILTSVIKYKINKKLIKNYMLLKV